MKAHTHDKALYRFRLYVADDTQNSAQALANLTALCDAHLPNRHEIEVVDVFKHPAQALAESIFMTPTLVRLSPGPVRRVVGTLSNARTVLLAMEVHAIAA
jgi:circadian clock protein KaiB